MKPTQRQSFDLSTAQNKFKVWIQACPQCAQVWVIGDVAEGEVYCCKACAHEYRIGYEHCPERLAPTSP